MAERGPAGRGLLTGRVLMARASSLFAAALGTVVVGLMAVVPSAAVAATAESGLWWFDRGNIQAAHDAGFDGAGVKVAVIDTQVNPDVVGLRGADVKVVEPSYCFDAGGQPYPATSTDYVAASHGTNVASMIVGTGDAPAGGVPIKGVAPGVELLYYNSGGVLDGVESENSVWGGDAECLLENGKSVDDAGQDGLGRAISDAVDAGADIISISSGGGVDSVAQIAKAHAAGVIVVAAMSNDSGSAGFPAAMNGVVAVQAFGEDGNIQVGDSGKPNLSDDVDIAGPGLNVLLQGSAASWDEQLLGSGTSYAAPIVAGMLAVVKQKYPAATGPQLVQSLIHNTGTKGEHDPVWDRSGGYGAASLTGMLAVDPTKYPDVNPLFDSEDPQAFPNLDDVERAAAALDTSTQPSPPTSDVGPPPSNDSPFVPWLIGGGIVLVLLIIGGIILAIVLARRTRR